MQMRAWASVHETKARICRRCTNARIANDAENAEDGEGGIMEVGAKPTFIARRLMRTNGMTWSNGLADRDFRTTTLYVCDMSVETQKKPSRATIRCIRRIPRSGRTACIQKDDEYQNDTSERCERSESPSDAPFTIGRLNSPEGSPLKVMSECDCTQGNPRAHTHMRFCHDAIVYS